MSRRAVGSLALRACQQPAALAHLARIAASQVPAALGPAPLRAVHTPAAPHRAAAAALAAQSSSLARLSTCSAAFAATKSVPRASLSTTAAATAPRIVPAAAASTSSLARSGAVNTMLSHILSVQAAAASTSASAAYNTRANGASRPAAASQRAPAVEYRAVLTGASLSPRFRRALLDHVARAFSTRAAFLASRRCNANNADNANNAGNSKPAVADAAAAQAALAAQPWGSASAPASNASAGAGAGSWATSSTAAAAKPAANAANGAAASAAAPGNAAHEAAYVINDTGMHTIGGGNNNNNPAAAAAAAAARAHAVSGGGGGNNNNNNSNTGKEGESTSERNLRYGYYMMALAIVSLGVSYLAVPLYAAFCQMTGLGGTTQRDVKVEERNQYQQRTAHLDPDAPPLREITVRFEAMVAPALDWEFRPCQEEIKLRIGDTALAFYKAKNNMTQPWVGVATYNVLPASAGLYFNKIQCFCFDEQRLRSGEEMDMPLFFFLDPAMADDWRMDGTDLITLSYTFFPVAADEVEAMDPRVNRVTPLKTNNSTATTLLPTTPGVVQLKPGQSPEDLLVCEIPPKKTVSK